MAIFNNNPNTINRHTVRSVLNLMILKEGLGESEYNEVISDVNEVENLVNNGELEPDDINITVDEPSLECDLNNTAAIALAIENDDDLYKKYIAALKDVKALKNKILDRYGKQASDEVAAVLRDSQSSDNIILSNAAKNVANQIINDKIK